LFATIWVNIWVKPQRESIPNVIFPILQIDLRFDLI